MSGASDSAAPGADLPPSPSRLMTLAQFRQLEAALLTRGYAEMIEWSETIAPPRDCRTFAKEIIFVIVNSGMRFTIANRIYWKCLRALAAASPPRRSMATPAKPKPSTTFGNTVKCSSRLTRSPTTS